MLKEYLCGICKMILFTGNNFTKLKEDQNFTVKKNWICWKKKRLQRIYLEKM